MRNYKKLMQQYRLPRDRYIYLRDMCRRYRLLSDDGKRPIDEAVFIMLGEGEKTDMLAAWVFRYVTSDRYSWARLHAMGIPCGEDTFRVYRARFFWTLDGVLRN